MFVKQTTTKNKFNEENNFRLCVIEQLICIYLNPSVLLNSNKQALSFVTICNNTGRSDGPCPEDGLDEAIQASRRER